MKKQYQPYTYLLGWSKLNVWYYGCEYGKGTKTANPKNLWKTYFSNSKYVKNFRKEHGEPDIIQIRMKFENEKECRDWEHKVLRRMHVIDKPEQWLNKTDNKAIALMFGKNNGMFGKKPWNKGMKMSPEFIEKNRITHIGQKPWNLGVSPSPEQIERLKKLRIGIAPALKGKTMTEKQKVNMYKPKSDSSKMGRHERTDVVLKNMSQSQKVSWSKIETDEKELRIAKLRTIASNRGNRGQKWKLENGKRVYYTP